MRRMCGGPSNSVCRETASVLDVCSGTPFQTTDRSIPIHLASQDAGSEEVTTSRCLMNSKTRRLLVSTAVAVTPATAQASFPPLSKGSHDSGGYV